MKHRNEMTIKKSFLYNACPAVTGCDAMLVCFHFDLLTPLYLGDDFAHFDDERLVAVVEIKFVEDGARVVLVQVLESQVVLVTFCKIRQRIS